MENYRIYEKKTGNVLTKTSYYGSKKVIRKIFKILNKSKNNIYFMGKDYEIDECNKNNSLLLKGSKEEKCYICGKPTKYIEICTESHMCSEKCVNKFYKSYNKYLENTPDIE